MTDIQPQPNETPGDPQNQDNADAVANSRGELDGKKKFSWKKMRQKIENFLEHPVYVTFMTIVTIYILFADDVRQLISWRYVDNGFFVTASVCMGFFVLEIFLSCLAKPGYFLGFFFFLDLVSTGSLIFDIGWLSNLVFGTTGSTPGAAGAARLARAGRASRVGTRAGRIVRVVRLIRLIRIVKLYKAAQTTLVQNVPQEQIDDESELRDGTFGKSATMVLPKPGSSVINRELQNNLGANGGSRLNLDGKGSLTDLQKKASLNEIPKSATVAVKKYSMNEDLRREGTIDAMAKLAPINEIRSKEVVDPRPATRTVQNTLVAAGGDRSAALSGGKDASAQIGQASEIKPDDKKFELPQETNVGRKLSDLTTKRVITLVMSVMISIPLFTVDTYVTDYTSCESGLKSLYALYQSGDTVAYELAKNNYITYHTGIRDPIVVLSISKTNIPLSLINEDSLRDSEKQYYNIPDQYGNTAAYAVFDLRADTKLNSILGISRTIFVTLVLTAAALFFSKDANDLVLSPIENMLVKVKRIAENPLAAAQIEEEDALMRENMEKEGKYKEFLKKDEGNYETNILEKTILKLGALLALGFGEAGSNIIAQNMSKSGDVDPMIPGKKILAIFGFCDIRQFTDATEVLQEGVMVFVNEIAEIVHGTINEYSGAANKNIGDAFLLVWKFPEDEVEPDPDDPSNLKLKQSLKVSQLADMSIVSFLKVLSGINKSKKLEKYRHNDGLNQRIKNYSVKMGFGLHVGWAIEGAIGSEYKIDASYLSPNVNMAARLEAATKQFGVPILISGALHSLCTPETQRHLRHIDRVTVKGSIQPIDLYTCDVDYNRLAIDKNEVDNTARTAIEKKQARVESRMKKDELREKAFSGKNKIAKKFQIDKDLVTMRKPFTREFEDKFKEGMDNYISGNWSKARDMFEHTLKMIPNREKDGPSNTLLNVMSEFGFRAPHDWKGYRELTEK